MWPTNSWRRSSYLFPLTNNSNSGRNVLGIKTTRHAGGFSLEQLEHFTFAIWVKHTCHNWGFQRDSIPLAAGGKSWIQHFKVTLLWATMTARPGICVILFYQIDYNILPIGFRVFTVQLSFAKLYYNVARMYICVILFQKNNWRFVKHEIVTAIWISCIFTTH